MHTYNFGEENPVVKIFEEEVRGKVLGGKVLSTPFWGNQRGKSEKKFGSQLFHTQNAKKIVKLIVNRNYSRIITIRGRE